MNGMKKASSLLQTTLLAAGMAGAQFAQAALPEGAEDIGPAVIVDMGLAAGYGGAVLLAGLGLTIGFDLLKKFIKKGAS